MADKARAAEFKAKGNAAVTRQAFDEAVEFYTQAIEADPTDHVLYSNRSAAYLSKSDAVSALADAEKCVTLNGSWAKGYGRKGAALYALRRYPDAVATYQEGLAIEPANDTLKSGLAEAQAAASRSSRPAARPNPFGAEAFSKLASNPRFLPYIADPAFQRDLQRLQSDEKYRTNVIMTLMQKQMGGAAGMQFPGMEAPSTEPVDPRITEAMLFLLGADREDGEEGDDDEDGGDHGMMGGAGRSAGGYDVPSTGSAASSSAGSRSSGASSSASAPAPAPPAEEQDMSEEAVAKRDARRRALAKKDEGNTHYRARRFEEALSAYSEAAELDPEDMTYDLNRAAVYLEMNNFESCITTCREAIEKGRAAFAPYPTIAKAYARIGTAYQKQGNHKAALEAYEQSLLESHSEDVETKAKNLRREIKKAEELAYRDPILGAEAKERGNEAFKAGDFPLAVQEYSEAIKRDPENAVYYANRATARSKLMDFSNALDDCEKALKIDPRYAKAYVRKGNIQFLMKEYHKALDTFQKALELEGDNAEAKDGLRRTVMKINESASSDQHDPERAARAMADPEIQAIMKDPMVSAAIQDIQSNPRNIATVMSDPSMAAKFQKLIAAGVLSVR